MWYCCGTVAIMTSCGSNMLPYCMWASRTNYQLWLKYASILYVGISDKLLPRAWPKYFMLPQWPGLAPKQNKHQAIRDSLQFASKFFWEVGEWGWREGFGRKMHMLVILLYSVITTDVVSSTRGSWKRDSYYPGLLFILKDLLYFRFVYVSRFSTVWSW